mmetsp:Transcript_33080/g.57971  ORF Transcript_33080/g.57971 Transcript_33080/m.57971 type:complete len:200 (-) Transcript_33080:15-614(-)
MCPILQYQLLQIQKCPFMPHTLSNLHQNLPRTLTKRRLTFRTLLIPHYKINNKRLLQYSPPTLHLSLNRKPNLKPHRMRLRPHPRSIHQPNLPPIIILPLLQPTDIRQTQRHELSTFELASDPFAGILMPSTASTALVEGCFGGDAAGDVGLGGEAGGAGVRGVGCDGGGADATEDGGGGAAGDSAVAWLDGADVHYCC